MTFAPRSAAPHAVDRANQGERGEGARDDTQEMLRPVILGSYGTLSSPKHHRVRLPSPKLAPLGRYMYKTNMPPSCVPNPLWFVDGKTSFRTPRRTSSAP
jgi:hypothetical protein